MSTVYYIHGDDCHPERIKEALLKAGAKVNDKNCADPKILYYINKEGRVHAIIADSELGEMLQDLGTELYTNTEPQFQHFQKVLGRDRDDEMWCADIYSHYDHKKNHHYCVGGNHWRQYVPYEGNEHLLGTTDNPK